MNIKLIIVWLFAIVVIAGIGVFGLVNQDLLVEQDKDVYNAGPLGTDENTRKCEKNITDATSSYTFEIDPETNQITKITLTYNTLNQSGDFERYTAAESIVNANMNGVNAKLEGTDTSFIFMATIDLATYDRASVELLNEEFNKLHMIVDGTTDYNAYVTAINDGEQGNPYVCE